MKRLSARFLAGMSVEDLKKSLTGQFIVVFDDGEIVTNHFETIYSAYAWVFHRTYPDTPMLKRHHVQHTLGGKRLNSDTHLELLGEVHWSVYDTYYKPDGTGKVSFSGEPKLRDDLARLLAITSNVMYNEQIEDCDAHVAALDILDFTEAMEHPEIFAANASVIGTPASISKTYSTIQSVLMDPAKLPHNNLAKAAQSGTVKMGQLLQCIGPRGFMTDTDSHQFAVPVLVGYAMGFRSILDSAMESRSAAKSLMFSKTPLQTAEYFSRRLQLMSQIVQHLHRGDCGSTEYLKWYVKDDVYHGKKRVTKGDLGQLAGKQYLDVDTGTLKVISRDDKHLVKKNILLRSPLHCAHPDPYGICETCFGTLSLSVPERTNIGQMCCTSLAQKSTQNVLSVKHLDGSTEIDDARLDFDGRNYLAVGVVGNTYLLADKLKGKSVHLVIPPERANMLDIMEPASETMNVTRLSELAVIGIRIKEANREYIVEVDVSMHRRMASLTKEMLRHIRTHGYGIDDEGNFSIDMKEWDWSHPLLELPLRHRNMSDHSKDIASLLESSMEKMQERDAALSPDSVIVDLHELVNDKLTVNLAVLEVVLLATMIESAERRRYNLPKPWTSKGLGVMRQSMASRSLTSTMAYQDHRDVIMNPLSYIDKNRPDHPFDGILMPREVFHQDLQT